MGIENLVLLMSSALDDTAWCDCFDALIKIYSVLPFSRPEQRVNIRLELNFQVILVDFDFINYQF